MGTASRVLPWRRHHTATADELAPLLTAFRAKHPKAPIGRINRAYEVAREAHKHQTRTTGELYINHPIAVARVIADIGLDEASIVAALLHDAVEDTDLTLADVESEFGPEVAALFLVTEIRVRAEQKGIVSVETESNRLKCLRSSGRRDDFVMLGSRFPRLTSTKPLLRLKEIIVFLNNLPRP
jgi:(p)ppGpp synthase/HD superfamily hydrolase